jgi:beta-N-acetylhexosaminidase
VDTSVLRILTLKFRIYKEIFTLSQVLPAQDGLANLGKSSQTTFQVAQEAVTLISPSLTDLAETLPESPNLNDQVVFISQVRTAQQCSECPEQQVFARDAFEQAVIRLYGPSAGGQVLQRNLDSYSFEDLEALLDQNDHRPDRC